MKIFVIGRNGLGLMPTTPRKARILLKEGKARIVRKVPFTIQLTIKTGCATQQVYVGIDTGSQHIGAAVTTDREVLSKAEYSLRSSMEKKSLLEMRKQYRRGRRYRKVRYRKPKFKPHTKRIYHEEPVDRTKVIVDRDGKHRTVHFKSHWEKKVIGYTTNRREGWTPPSIASKIGHHIRIIGRYREALPPKAALRIEAARFDIARIKDPSVHGEMYQRGRMYDYENVKAYVFDRDGYRCRVCGAKAGTKRPDGTTVKLIAHHTDYRSEGSTDNPDRMAAVWDACHTGKAHKPGGILYQWMLEGKRFSRGYRDMTFMNILRRRLFKAFPDAEFTYGNITAADRKALGLEKSHANDAEAIAFPEHKLTDTEETVYYQQVRSRKRSLHEATARKGRKEPNRTAKRNRKNTVSVTIGRKGNRRTFFVYDRVVYRGQAGWISGFTGQSAYVKDKNDRYIKAPGKAYNQVNLSELKVISHSHNWLTGALVPIGK